jgi:hypothetical protein
VDKINLTLRVVQRLDAAMGNLIAISSTDIPERKIPDGKLLVSVM